LQSRGPVSQPRRALWSTAIGGPWLARWWRRGRKEARGVTPAGNEPDSTAALAEALERERFVGRISAQVRSELDVDKLLRVAVRETGTALRVDRCFIRLGAAGDDPVAAQWHVPSLAPIETGRGLAVSNLAARRREAVAIEDTQAAPELDDTSL